MSFLVKKEIRANGKIIICDFKQLNPKDFILLPDLNTKNILSRVVLFGSDGKIYINNKIDGWFFLAGVFETIIPESQYTLEQFCKTFKEKYKNITFDNICGIRCGGKYTDEEITQAFALLCIPVELKRRSIEKAYYGKICPFPAR